MSTTNGRRYCAEHEFYYPDDLECYYCLQSAHDEARAQQVFWRSQTQTMVAGERELREQLRNTGEYARRLHAALHEVGFGSVADTLRRELAPTMSTERGSLCDTGTASDDQEPETGSWSEGASAGHAAECIRGLKDEP